MFHVAILSTSSYAPALFLRLKMRSFWVLTKLGGNRKGKLKEM